MKFICVGIIPRVMCESVDNLPFIGNPQNTTLQMTTHQWKINVLTFSPGVNVSCTTIIPIVDDSVLESDEVFSVTLSTTDSDVSLDPASATVSKVCLIVIDGWGISDATKG